ncbi:MAG: hypothetical protein C0475_08810 [Planctomyces sp.]|nr:hypothetical protein [Planctomyces sp.]MBA4039194.1 hypothetical protein [Planctomyces sp.]MBA4120777.1 hypothetical protein [Isosphaera sp.]
MGGIRQRFRRAFTLIELLVVISIIALLIGILLPALGNARKEGRALTAASNLRSIAQGLSAYSIDFRVLPLSYYYQTSGENPQNWRVSEQFGSGAPNGYLHWSFFLLATRNTTTTEAFFNPAVPRGGAPRSNPGGNFEDWETEQTNDLGSGAGSPTPEDLQSRRMGFTANYALMPRNKLAGSATIRRNRFVRPNEADTTLSGASKTILATEWHYADNWRSLASTDAEGGQLTIKSHRPVYPFWHGSAGPQYPDDIPARNFGTREIIEFRYPRVVDSNGQPSGEGIRPVEEVGISAINDRGSTNLNVVGRSHPGSMDRFGGTTNFLFLDGHVERLKLVDTITRRLWGDRIFGISGPNRVEPARN